MATRTFPPQVIQHEGVCSVHFVDSFAVKNDHALNSTLFIGTTLGSVIVVIINLPDRGDPRVNEPVVVSPSGSLIRIRGPLLTMAFLDSSNGNLTTRGGETLENVRAPARPSSSPPAGASKEDSVNLGDQQVCHFTLGYKRQEKRSSPMSITLSGHHDRKPKSISLLHFLSLLWLPFILMRFNAKTEL